MADREQNSEIGDVSNAAETLHHLAMAVLHTATDTLGWREPREKLTRERTSSSYYATALHQYGSSLAMLTIFVTSEHNVPFDVRVTCELADTELVNAERIVHEAGVADEEVREWLTRQLDRCLAALESRVAGR